jgi:hypothetical protein
MTCTKGFGGLGAERKRHPHTHRAERPGIEPVAGEQSRDRLAAKIQDLPPVDPLQGRTRRRPQVGTAAIVRGGRCLCHPVGTPQVQADARPDQRRQRLVRPGTPGQPNTLCPLGIMSRQRRNIGSRVTREGHARFWERPGVKFRRATRRTSPFRGEDRKVCNRRKPEARDVATELPLSADSGRSQFARPGCPRFESGRSKLADRIAARREPNKCGRER